jgi:diacylglycerol kinase family enzyme
MSKLKIFAFFPFVLFSKHESLNEVSLKNCKEIEISYEGVRKVCLDGNTYYWEAPLKLEIMPQALNVLIQ